MRLGDFLALPRPPWDWQAHDCSRWVDRWVRARGHGSPMVALGIRYDSEIGALRRIAEGGGLVQLWSAGMAMLFLPEADCPRAGDVGVIQHATDCGSNEAVAICAGERWASLTLRGLDFSPAIPLRSWRV